MATTRPPADPRPRPAAPDVAAATLQRAFSDHQHGRLDQAEALYREVLAIVPAHPYALHMLGLVRLQRGDFATAQALVERSLALQPQQAEAHSNLGLILFRMERFDEALGHCDRALALKPDYAEALNNRGNALHRLRRFDEALACYERALALRPDYVEALDNRGVTLAQTGRHEAALASHDRALALAPGHVEALVNRGHALRGCGREGEALASYERAIVLVPGHAEAQLGRGDLLQAQGRHGEALAAYGLASAELPGRADLHFRRGNVLVELRRYRGAVAAFDQAIALQPDFVEALHNRGVALGNLKEFDAALASYDRALALAPDYARTHCSRGNLLRDAGRIDEAVRAFARLLEVAPDYPFASGLLLHARMLACDWTDFARLAEALERDVAAGRPAGEPFGYMAISASERNLQTCAETFARFHYPRVAPSSWDGGTFDGPRIRVGYLCGEFRNQATSILMAELFELHDRGRFELFALDNGWDDGSPLRRRIERAFDEVVPIAGKSDAEALEAIRSRRIEILVNLNGYFGLGRQAIFSRRPCPVQVNYLGFPGTIGADYIDYIIADRHVVPPGHDAFYTEKVVRLPDCYQANDRRRVTAPRTPSRGELGLPGEGFVFCCFNNTYKITPRVFDVWMRLLAQVQGSVLWLLAANDAAVANLRREAQSRGIAADRIVFAPRADPDAHLARHRQADLFLDTLPYNAHTTASDALWTGLPVVTCTGDTFPGRVASSLLHALGLPELITTSLADYEALALRLATDPQALTAVRGKLAANRATRPLFDTDRFRRHLEAAYATMSSRFRRGDPPEAFSVEAVDGPA